MTKEFYGSKRAELFASAEKAIADSDMVTFDAKKAEIEKLDADFESEAKASANLNALRGAAVSGAGAQMLAAAGKILGSAEPIGESFTDRDIYAARDYEHAFMNWVTKGTAIPGKYMDTAQQTTTGDVGAVIPTEIVNKIFEKLSSTGKIWALVTKTNYKGGVSVPTSSAKPVASWVAERSTSETQKKLVGSVTFAYNKLICKVAISFETSIVTLDVFNQTLVANIAEAMLKKLEQGVISGDGSGKLEGILHSSAPAGQNIDIAKTAGVSYANIVAAEGALPQSYDSGAVWVMAKKTFMSEYVGLVDAEGQPVVTHVLGVNGKPVYYILGRPVIIVDADYLPNFAKSVDTDTVFAFIYDFSYYFVNTNYAVTMRDYIDEDTDDIVKKALMLVDGKPIDINSLVTLTKKSS